MRSTKLTRFVLSGVAVFLIAIVLFADPPADGNLKVMKMGVGSGTVTSSPAGINCGTDCDETFVSTVPVVLTATAAAGSTFVGWDVDPDADAGTTPDCTGTSPCTLTMNTHRSVRPVFDLSPAIPTLTSFTPEGIQTYLTTNSSVNSVARFLKGLPSEYKQNWILMSRSESLQTGTAESPRILLPSADARFVFTIGMTTHSSYPGAHPNAIEYMQFDETEKNFRFHEIVLDAIPAMGSAPARSRGVSIDDAKCSKCHSTRNVLNRTSSPGTTGIPPGTVKAKNKPNWDTYDSWAGMTPFNRDRIYQGSLEAAAFRTLLNPWTWRTNDSVRSIIEQLKLQPPGVSAPEAITRLRGGTNDGVVKFAFDTTPPAFPEPAPSGTDPSISTSYSFDGVAGTGAATSVTRGGSFVTLRHSGTVSGSGIDVEGRGVQLFDLLGGADGNLNPQRIADELINHRFATGSVPIDVRPIALAITKRCLNIDTTSNTVTSTPALTINLSFFDSRNGMRINELVADTKTRAESIPRRKADLQKLDLDRSIDPYLLGEPTPNPAVNGLILQYGSATSASTDTSMTRIRQEVFRRPNDLGRPDNTVMGRIYVDRELYGTNADPTSADYTNLNTRKVALFRYFLEPLGVSVDKWSMGVRGRSLTYTFADVFGAYENVLQPELQASLTINPVQPLAAPYNCADIIGAVNSTLSSLPAANAVPTYTDVQRIFNKSCIECHGGLDYPPYVNYGTFLNLAENEAPPAGETPLTRPYGIAVGYASSLMGPLYRRINRTDEGCPFGLMPCGGPALSKVDIETIRRWIEGGNPATEGDPHIKTIDGVNYDFQSAGEFVLLRDDNLEIQARQTAVETAGPLGPNGHTGLSSCVSLNTAVAVRVGAHRITYQPNLSGEPDPSGLQLRIDGKLTTIGAQEIRLASGGRIIRTTAPGGILIESAGGTVIVLTPGWWDHYQLWYMNIDVRKARATQGVMGAIAPGNWLPALPDGSLLGPRPRDLHQRYVVLYEKFEDAWRVSDTTTLFDYSSGFSTTSFTITSWPLENPQNCTVPQQRGGPIARPPVPALALQVAQQHCGPLVAEDRRANCIQDAMATGDPGFAKTYLLTEQIERNKIPTAPNLDFPEDNKADFDSRAAFSWGDATDSDGDILTYRHCVWPVNAAFTLNSCDADPVRTTSAPGRLRCVLLLVLIVCLLLLLIFLAIKRKRGPLIIVAIVLLAVVILTFYLCRPQTRSTPTTSKSVAGLESGKSYFWKVIVDDGKGGTAESETRRFTAK